LKPLLDQGYFRRLPPASFADAPAAVTGKYSISAKLEEHRYLGIVRLGWQMRGCVIRSPGKEMSLVFLKPSGAASFVGAAKLTRAKADKESEGVFTWRLFLSPLLFPDRTTPLEIWIFDCKANQFVKLGAFDQV